MAKQSFYVKADLPFCIEKAESKSYDLTDFQEKFQWTAKFNTMKGAIKNNIR